jgi:non-specific serine/threonine protein kinase
MAGAAAWDGERVVYGGGVGSAGVSTDVFALVGDAWHEIGDLPRPREHLAATSDGSGTTWILGGRVLSLESNLGDVAVISGNEVRALSATLSRRGGVAAFWAEGLGACLTGGEAPDMAYRTVECVDAEGTITTLPDMTQPRHGHGAAVVGGSAYAVLGGPEPFLTASSTVEALDLP